MKIKFNLMVFLLSLILLNSYSCYSDPNISIEVVSKSETVIKNDEMSISFNLKSDVPINIATFRVKVTFDTNKFLYKRLNSEIGTNDFKTNLSGNTLNVIYLTSSVGKDIPPNKDTELFELTFKVLPNATNGNTKISTSFDGIASYDAHEISSPYIEPLNITISEKPKFNCGLKSLSVVGFTLTPEFKTEILQYYVDVPYYINTISFNVAPIEPTATVKISRKTLNSAGKSTDIKITVSSPDRKYKEIYTVTVNRAAKDKTNNKSSSRKSTRSSTKNPTKSKSVNSTPKPTKNNKTDPEEYVINSNGNNQKPPRPLVVNNSEFNFALFFTVCAILLIVSSYIIKSNNKK